jgi:hypothetical protein
MDVVERDQQKWPWDFDEMSKGDSISEVELLKASGLDKYAPSYNFWCMELKTAIMTHKHDMGEPVVVAMVKGAMVLLPDIDAAEYTERHFKAHMRAMTRNHGHQLLVDDSGFGEADQAAHRRRLQTNGRTIQGALLGRRNKLVLKDTKPNALGLPGA